MTDTSDAFDIEARPDSPYAYRLEYRDEEAEVYGRGYFVVRNEDGQALAWRTLPRSDGLEAINVAGEDYHIDELQSPAFAPGTPLALVREPDNPHDESAVAVYDAEQKLHIGYIPASDSERIARKLDRGEEWRCYSMWEQIDREGRRTQLRVLLLSGDASVRLSA